MDDAITFFPLVFRRIDNGARYLAVVKVILYHNASQALNEYCSLVQPYCRKIELGYNILPFTLCKVTDRSGILLREYVDHSLLDRMCTRPFLCMEEKKWIAFQLLQALAQLHLAGNFSGDGGQVDGRWDWGGAIVWPI
ncbi:unnamed protein product [Protopolystoma xenopodis]|uniref:Protein kinase domain-containing protein n=1 Tax=Protopolystoma xenopodis TaxID=117903 RepID=A0A3S5BW60_9PLAT|nr:unnamed protein product [Protopolystoma xenopodis]